MPAERISKGFKDVSASFKVNPLNSDLIALRNENAIARSVRNCVFTIRGEKPFFPEFGSRVSELLFDSLDNLTAESIKTEIEDTINNFEPRVSLDEVIVEPNYDSNQFDVTIKYDIIGAPLERQQLEFALQLTR